MRTRRLRKEAAHLEITAFINLIVVLVPFLLSTAVFTRLAVMDLQLPAQQSAVQQKGHQHHDQVDEGGDLQMRSFLAQASRSHGEARL